MQKARHHAYIVKWRDSSTLRGWRAYNDTSHEVAIITSVGWMVKQTPRTVTLTTGISECGNVCDAITIPREAITKLQRLKPYVLGE